MGTKESVQKALAGILDRVPDDAQVVILSENVLYDYMKSNIDISMTIRYYEKPKFSEDA